MAGPTNNWMENRPLRETSPAFLGCMAGRTMYVVPFVMGPIGSPLAKVGVQLTDSIYVAISMGIMTRMGEHRLGSNWATAMNSPLPAQLGDVNPERRYLPFPLDNTIWSFGSGYGGNALLGKKCLALRIASFLGRQQGWMAEHMLLMGATDPRRREDLCRRRLSQRLREDQFRDDDSRRKISPRKGGKSPPSAMTSRGCGSIKKSGRLRAINPEAGYFGVVPGTNPSRPTPTPWRACRTTRFTPMSPCCPMAMSGGKARPMSRPPPASTGPANPGRPIATTASESRPSQQPVHRADDQQSRARSRRQ
jgi:phosphoenolpyruvate carboxykinase (GTP)